MFFHIGKQPQKNFSEQWQLGSFSVGTDPGWQQINIKNYDIVFKGYADFVVLEDSLEEIVKQTEPTTIGNFCAIVYNRNTRQLSIKSDRYRSFPIYVDPFNSVNNLVPTTHTAWTDSLIIVNEDFSVVENKFNVIGTIETESSTVDQIDQLLTDKVQQFYQNNGKPIKVYLSGGIDTLLVYSYVKKLDIPHELVWSLHCDLNKFMLANHGDITRNWGYQQIHHWNEPCILASGAPGDEYMLRSPATANMYLMYAGTNIPKELDKNNNVLHRTYFLEAKHTNLFAQQIENYKPPQSKEELDWSLCNMVINDWQHWHLGNTLTWTPLRDIELFKLCLRLPYELALGQIMNSSVSQQIIEQNVPGLTQVIGEQKNSGNFMSNLQKLLT